MICCSSWFRLRFRCLSPFCFLLAFLRSDFVVFPGSGWVPVLVSLLLSSFFSSERGSVPSWCPGSFWFRLGFRCLFPFFSLFSFFRNGVLFHHDFLVPGGSGSGAGACLPSSFFFLFSGNGVLFPGSGSGSGASLPSSLFFLYLSFLRKGVLFHHDLLVAPGSGSGSRGCLPSYLFFLFFLFFQETGLCSIMISWFLLVPVLVPVLVSPFFFCQEEGFVPNWFPGFSSFRLGFRCLCPFFSLLFIFSGKTVLFCHDCMVPFLLRLLVFLFDFISDQWISIWAMDEGK